MEESKNDPSIREKAVISDDVTRKYLGIREKSSEVDSKVARISRKLSMQGVLVGNEGTTWHLFEHNRGLDRSKAVGNKAKLGECLELGSGMVSAESGVCGRRASGGRLPCQNPKVDQARSKWQHHSH